MTDPTERPDPGSINEATREAVEADRARVIGANAAARRRGSLRGRSERIWRWLRNRQSGPLPRIHRVGSVLKATFHARGPWRQLPEALATALLAPVRLPGKPPPPARPRDWTREREGARLRLVRAAERLRDRDPASLRLAVIADAPELARLSEVHDLDELRPEDWADVLDAGLAAGSCPDLLLVTTARNGNGGAWTYRIAWTAHPDGILHRDLDALTNWCAAHDVPTVFATTEAGPAFDAIWGDAARLFDLVLVPDATIAAAVDERPDRRGTGARLAPVGLAADIAAALGAISPRDAPEPAP
ncbi:MAG: hypothetical protein HYX57_04070 [Chloroflexi bacterium]|nr:hypothetical protein [Chloroflexota bacterium]